MEEEIEGWLLPTFFGCGLQSYFPAISISLRETAHFLIGESVAFL